ncbi:MAG: outer membrane beta-barrel protein [Flavobacteriales bacterium]|nr:outer membrane beta-barrel protein [Flavobacteriales bacterium]
MVRLSILILLLFPVFVFSQDTTIVSRLITSIEGNAGIAMPSVIESKLVDELHDSYTSINGFNVGYSLFIPLAKGFSIKLGMQYTRVGYGFDYLNDNYDLYQIHIDRMIGLFDMPLGLQYSLIPSDKIEFRINAEGGISVKNIVSEEYITTTDFYTYRNNSNSLPNGVNGFLLGGEFAILYSLSNNLKLGIGSKFRYYSDAIDEYINEKESVSKLSVFQINSMIEYCFDRNERRKDQNITTTSKKQMKASNKVDSLSYDFKIRYRNTLQADFKIFEGLILVGCERIVISQRRYKAGIKAGLGYGMEGPIIPFGFTNLISFGDVHVETNLEYVYWINNSGRGVLIPQVGLRYQKRDSRFMVKVYSIPFIVESLNLSSPFVNSLEQFGASVGYSFWE